MVPDSRVDEEPPIEEILDTIGDRLARQILAELSRSPRSAQELASALDIDIATAYRHLNALEEYDLVTHRTVISTRGNHYKEYRCNFRSTVISLDDDAYDVRIFRRENLPDSFAQLWDELRQR